MKKMAGIELSRKKADRASLLAPHMETRVKAFGHKIWLNGTH